MPVQSSTRDRRRPEFSSAAFTQSELWGVTRNPWNTKYSSGGSSGGSAVALATGMTHLATGSDVAGSIRTPSSLNGIVGFQATAWPCPR